MSNSPNPQLNLDPIGHFLCLKHGEPFRKEWPSGIAQILILGLDWIGGKMEPEPEGFQAYLDELKAVEQRLNIDSAQAIPIVLKEKSVCCRVSEERLLEMYRAADVGKWAICERCGKAAFGFFYRVNMNPPWKRKSNVRQFEHLCFGCMQNTTVLKE
jgi:hypothetical protein